MKLFLIFLNFQFCEMEDLILLAIQYLSAILVLLHQMIGLICTWPVLILMTTLAFFYLKNRFSKPNFCQNCNEDYDVSPFNFDQEPEMETLESSDDEEIDDNDSGFVGSTHGEISLEQGSKILSQELNKTREIQR